MKKITIKISKLSHIFILIVIAHLNLAMPERKLLDTGDVCIMDTGIHMVHHSNNHDLYDHRKQIPYPGHKKGIQELKNICNMDMSSDIYFPGGRHPFVNNTTLSFNYEKFNREAVFFGLSQSTDGFPPLIDNPPELTS